MHVRIYLALAFILPCSIVCSTSTSELAQIRGFDLINDATNYAQKKNMMRGSVINFGHIRDTIASEGVEKATEQLSHTFAAYHDDAPDTSMQEIRTTLKESLGRLSCVVQQLQMQVVTHFVGPSDNETFTEVNKHLSEIAQDLLQRQHAMPSPLTRETALQTGVALATYAQSLEEITDVYAQEQPRMVEVPDTSEKEHSIENISHLLVHNANTIQKLETTVQNLPLTWYNTTYRTLCNACDALPKKKIGLGAGALVGAGLLSLYLVPDSWKSEDDPQNMSYTTALANNVHALSSYVYGSIYASPYQLSDEQLRDVKKNIKDNFGNADLQQVQLYNRVARSLQEEDSAHLSHDISTYVDEKIAEQQGIFPNINRIINSKLVKYGSALTLLQYIKSLTKIHHYTGGIWEPIREKLLNWHEQLKGMPSESMHHLQYGDYKTLDDPRFDAVRNDIGPLELIRQYINNPQDFAQGDINIPSTVLVTGPSGCGKSFVVDALANTIRHEHGDHHVIHFEESHWWMAKMQGADNGAHALIESAKSRAPCVIVIDEIHHCKLQRNTNSDFLSELLREMDNIDLNRDPDQQIFIVAATNDPQYLDQALLRDGRFGTRISLSNPGYEQRISILRTMCEQVAIDTSNIDFEYLASLTTGTPLSTLEKVFERATSLARRNNEPVSLEHFYIAINTVARKINAECHMSEQEKRCLASHMAARASLQYLHEPEQVDAVTICPYNAKIKEDNSLFHNSALSPNRNDNKQKTSEQSTVSYRSYGKVFNRNVHEEFTRQDAHHRKQHCKYLLAGSIGEHMLNNGIAMTDATDNLAQAYDEVCRIVCNDIPIEKLSERQQNEKREEAHQLYCQLKQEVEQTLQQYETFIAHIQDMLLREYFVHKVHIDAIYNEVMPAEGSA